ncbi:cell division protein DivIC [Lentibacillus kapialis]|uniref:Cell division protein DivIC n=1 Tax=Lentibacillus kapialis TaxID=340214 RepID=A0A917UZL4_9BACI|nr:septum formation initiator family protein [Lentibacillus kapialis]GGK01142.1 cell division protein DivIC [Lentibacillus kapialis]
MPLKEKNVTRLDSNYMQQYDAYIERQKRKKQRLRRRLVLFLIVVVIAFGSLASYHFNQRALQAEKKEQYEQLQSEMTALEKKENNLKEEINLLNDEEYVLDIARTNYFFSKKGELIFNIPDEKPSY